MNPLKLVFVTRSFWPLVGSAENVTADLAVELAGRGCRVTVLTARWEPDWPAEIYYHGVPVVRLPHAPQNRWKTFRYVRSLARWLLNHREHYDLVYVSMLKHDAYTVIRALRRCAAVRRVPVVLRPAAAGRHGDCLWQLDAPCGRRIKRECMKAAAFVGSSRAIERELQAAGYPRSRIHYLPTGVLIPSPRLPAAKTAARLVLAETDQALKIPGPGPLAVYTGRLHSAKGLQHLVAVWQPIAARRPGARLWLVGEGPDRAALGRQIDRLHLVGQAVLVGAVDDVSDLLAAADLFVLPGPQAGSSVALLEAMAAGLPIVAADVSGNRDLIDHQRHGLLVPAEDAAALSAAIDRLLDTPELAARLGAAARERAAEQFSLANMVDRHVTLLERLMHQDQP